MFFLKMKIYLLGLILFAIMLSSSCGNYIFPKVYNDTEDYLEAWELTERNVYYNGKNTGVLAVFPKEIADLDVIDFYCFHFEIIVGQPDYQIHLAVKYNDEEYKKEIQRLKSIKVLNNVRYDSENLSSPAYVAVWNWWDCYEYAICHDEDNTIDYVYLQEVYPPDTKLDDSLLPNNFKNGYEEYEDSDEYLNVGEFLGDWLGFDSFTIYE